MKREPNYLEGWPRLNLLEAHAALCEGREVFNFYQAGGQIGQCILARIDQDEVLLRYVFAYPGLMPVASDTWLPIEHVPNQVNRWRFYFLCPGCNRRIATLTWKHEWKCQKCHGLLYRQQLIPKNVATAEAIEALEAEIGRGRPFGMRQRAYRRKLDELVQYRSQVSWMVPPEASLDHQRIISAQWHRPNELPHGLWIDGYRVCDGKLVKSADGQWD